MKTIKYYKFKKKNDSYLNKFFSKNCFWAFSEEQLKEGLKKFNIENVDDLGKYFYRIYGGGFMLKSASKKYDKISKTRAKRLRKYLSNFDNAKDAFLYEMNNHECYYTGRFFDSIFALNMTRKKVFKNKKLKRAYYQSIEKIENFFENY